MQRHFKEATDERIQEIRILLQTRGFGNYGIFIDNNTYEGKGLFEKAIYVGAMVWDAIPETDKIDGKISKQTFVDIVWKFLNTLPQDYSLTLHAESNLTKPPLQNYSYLQGLEKIHLERLYDIYTQTDKAEENQGMGIAELCQIFIHLLRQDIMHNRIHMEQNEISLASTVTCIHHALKTYNAGQVAISRPEAVKQVMDGKPFALYLLEGRGGVYSEVLTTFGLNLVLTCKNAQGQIGHLPILCVLTRDHPIVNLSSIPELVEALKSVPVYNSYNRFYLPKVSADEMVSVSPTTQPKSQQTENNETFHGDHKQVTQLQAVKPDESQLLEQMMLEVLHQYNIFISLPLIQLIASYIYLHPYHVLDLKKIPNVFYHGPFSDFLKEQPLYIPATMSGITHTSSFQPMLFGSAESRVASTEPSRPPPLAFQHVPVRNNFDFSRLDLGPAADRKDAPTFGQQPAPPAPPRKFDFDFSGITWPTAQTPGLPQQGTPSLFGDLDFSTLFSKPDEAARQQREKAQGTNDKKDQQNKDGSNNTPP